MKKFFLGFLFIMCILWGVGCNYGEENVEKFDFKINKAKETANSYMISLSKGDVEKANSYCKDISITPEELSKTANNKINSFKLDEVIEKANYAYVNYKVARGNDEDVTAELDKISLKVVQEDDNYLINEVHTESLKQVYKSKDTLRIRDEENGKSKLLLRIKDLPKQIYPKREGVILTKEDVPSKDITKVSIGFQGERVAIVVGDKDNSAIIMAMIKESEAAIAEKKEDDNNADDKENNTEDLEIPVASSVIGYDILNNTRVNKILFSDDVGELMAELSTEENKNWVRVYKNPDGDLLNLKLYEVFPREKYSVSILRVTGEGTFIKVDPISDDANEYGEYIVDFTKETIERTESY